MKFCKCLYEIENNLPRTQHCFVPCLEQIEIMEERERLSKLFVKDDNNKLIINPDYLDKLDD